jgi:hypothetical protein
MHFSPLVFTRRYAIYFIAPVPERNLAAALGAIAMRINRFQEPYAVLKTEGAVGECAYGTNIDYVSYKIIVERFLDIGSDFRMIAAIQYTMHAFIRNLVGHIHAAEAKNATRHVQLYIGTKIMFFECASLKFVACAFLAMIIAEILQVTFTGLIADGTIERMVDQQKFHHTISCIDHSFAGNIFYHHSIHYIGAAAGHQFGHGSRIGR